jgi:hypothetical protein
VQLSVSRPEDWGTVGGDEVSRLCEHDGAGRGAIDRDRSLLAADQPRTAMSDQVTERIPVLRVP